jgi:hypothetical protein
VTLIKKGALAGLQVYLSVPWAKKPVTFRNPPPWAPSKVENLSGPQLLAAYSLAKSAYEYAYGKTGKIKYKGVMMPIGAVTVAQSVVKGAGVHGGKTIKERAELRHAAAAASLAYLESLIRTKGLALPTIGRPAVA